MPRRIHYETEPDPAFNPARDKPPEAFKDIVLSIVEFDPSQGEEIFLSYSKGLEHGPGIRRSGDRAPSMRRFFDVDNPFGETTDAEEQRIGTWFIDEDCAAQEIEDWGNTERALEQAIASGNEAEKKRLEQRLSVLRWTGDMARQGLIHDKQFGDNYQGYEVIGQQGCGDLTMNRWYVAYLCSPLTKNEPKLLWLYEEPVTERTYTCLVKWKPGKGPKDASFSEVTIEEAVKFEPLPDDRGRVRIGDRWVEEKIEFAVFGKQVIREGQVVDFRSVVHQFADIRHLLQLPNINLAGDLYPGDPAPIDPEDPEARRRVRYYYGQEWRNDVWLSEKQLLEDWNLQRAAVAGPVVLNRLYGGMGASIPQIGGIWDENQNQWIGGAMEQAKYQRAKDPRRLEVGEWQFVPWDHNLVEVYLKRSRYPWSMVGVDKEATRILCLACNGHQGRTGYTLEEAAATFLRATQKLGIELWSALLMDEGNDVFQKAFLNGTPRTTVPLRRRQVRAKFIFARKAPSPDES